MLKGCLLSEYHFKKHESYFLFPYKLVESTDCQTYSFTSLHSGANDADMLQRGSSRSVVDRKMTTEVK